MDTKTYHKTLKFAIRNEIKANEFYRQAAEKLKDESLGQLLSDLA